MKKLTAYLWHEAITHYGKYSFFFQCEMKAAQREKEGPYFPTPSNPLQGSYSL